MMGITEYSFIDYGNKDFLRDENDEVIIIKGDYQDAEDWLLDNGEKYGWTNESTKYIDWNE